MLHLYTNRIDNQSLGLSVLKLKCVRESERKESKMAHHVIMLKVLALMRNIRLHL